MKKVRAFAVPAALALAVAVVLFTGCSQQNRLEAKVQKQVRASLKDADSAKFGPIDIFPFAEGQVACGTVNAKNAFGAYAGARVFKVGLSPDGSVGSPDIAEDEKWSVAYQMICDFRKSWGAKPGNSGPNINVAKKHAEIAAAEVAYIQEKIAPTLVKLGYTN